MSTHWTAGILHEDGSITGCYVNFDGYESHARPALEAAVARYGVQGVLDEILRGRREGGIRDIDRIDGVVETYVDYRGNSELSKGVEWSHDETNLPLRAIWLVRESDGAVVSGRQLTE